jgi:hypothetical protein
MITVSLTIGFVMLSDLENIRILRSKVKFLHKAQHPMSTGKQDTTGKSFG